MDRPPTLRAQELARLSFLTDNEKKSLGATMEKK